MLSGIGQARAKQLARLSIHDVGDLLTYVPRTYDVYHTLPTLRKIHEAKQYTHVRLQGTIVRASVSRSRSKAYLAIERLTIADKTDTVPAVSFMPVRPRGRLPKPRYQVGEKVVLRGKINKYNGVPTLLDPERDEKSLAPHAELVVPRYGLTQGISQHMMQKFVATAWEYVTQAGLHKALQRKNNAEFAAMLTVNSVQSHHTCQALYVLHYPQNPAEIDMARRVLAWFELLNLQQRTGLVARGPGIPSPWAEQDGDKTERMLHNVPFQLTGAQQRVIAELRADMARQHGMRRVLCGDVGSGKSVIIAYALLKAVDAGGQGVLIAPTRILANQHAITMQRFFQGLNVNVALLTAQTPPDERKTIEEQITAGEVDVLIATHIGFSEGLKYHNLLVGVIDEQHRFGIDQRIALQQKNPYHTLWVSATPIPKTMAQIAYGGVPLSFLDERPPGRQKVETRCLLPHQRADVYGFLDKEVGRGGRAFVVCPFIDADEADIEGPAAVQTFTKLQNMKPGGRDVALIHGRLTPKEQEDAMQSFVQGKVGTLVATSMVEVGVDVPEATLMVIDGAEHFGLAQLHQLRGRVGRGDKKSYALFISDVPTDLAKQRLEALRSTYDGFALAEEDLKLRGPGEFSGMRQSGVADLQFADIVQHQDLFAKAAQMQNERWGTTPHT